MGLNRAVQVAAAAAMRSAVDVIGIARRSDGRPAVFAESQAFEDVLPRVTIEKPQILLLAVVCGVKTWEVFLTVHCWAGGAEGSLIVGDLADAVRVALDVDIAPAGYVVQDRDHFQGQRPATDPDPKVHHLVLTFRYLLKPN